METTQLMQLPLRSHLIGVDDSMVIDAPEIPPCHLLALPAEIRNQIYHLVLTSPYTEVMRRLVAHNYCSPYVLPPLPINPALLSTCKQINFEATPILYTLNTFDASPTLLTALPHFVSPSRRVTCPGISSKIRRWYINIRLEVDPRFSEEEVTKAFSGAEELEVEAREAMYRSAGVGNLLLFRNIRGVGKAKVHGSVDRDFAEWLEECMMGEPGSVFDDFNDGVERRMVGGVPEVFDIWRHANR